MISGVLIRYRVPNDDPEWCRLRRALWPDGSTADHELSMRQWVARQDSAVIVAARPNATTLAGFAEVGTRAYAEGCDSSPVAYLEGWYVDADQRRTGVGAALIRAAENWARERGLTEFASDALLGNTVSHLAHAALGYEEVVRTVHFRKKI